MADDGTSAWAGGRWSRSQWPATAPSRIAAPSLTEATRSPTSAGRRPRPSGRPATAPWKRTGRAGGTPRRRTTGSPRWRSTCTPSSAIGASTRSAGKTCCACSRRSGRASPRSDARSDSASARRWPGRRRTTTSRTTRPARRSTPRSRRRRRSRCTSARCRTPMSGRRSTSSRRHGRPCRRGRACGSSCSPPAGQERHGSPPGAKSTWMPASGASRRPG